MKVLNKLKIGFSHKNTTFLFRLLIGAIFIYASYDKLINPDQFAKAIANYRILPSFVVGVSAVWVPWLEFLCGIFLILGVFIRGGSLIISIMLIVYIAAIYSAIYRGIDISCGCFSLDETGEKVSYGVILRDFLFLIMSLQVLIFGNGFISLKKIQDFRHK